MQIQLEPMGADGIARFLTRSRQSYVTEQTASGIAAVDAELNATRQQEDAFPGGRPTGGHLLFDIVVDGSAVGYLWLGPVASDDHQWWIWDLEVTTAWQGRGVGRTVLLMAEHEVKSRGGREIGLQVFAANAVARHLYQTLGYRETSIRLRKEL